MIPIAEMAMRPGLLPLPLYLYEPSRQTAPTPQARAEREDAIGAIMALPPYCPRHGPACRSGRGNGGGGPNGDDSDGAGDGGGAGAGAGAGVLGMCPLVLGRRPLVAVVGDANLEAERVGDRAKKKFLAFEVGASGMVPHAPYCAACRC
jgi:hypothetical protein